MKPLSIRLKLTAWYVAILLASLSIFGVAAFFAMKKGIETSVDENLEGQAAGIEELMARTNRRANTPARRTEGTRRAARASGFFSRFPMKTVIGFAAHG